MLLRVYGVIYAALLTLAALTPRRIIPNFNLVLYFPAFWALFPCLFRSLSHRSYYIIKYLFWTLPYCSSTVSFQIQLYCLSLFSSLYFLSFGFRVYTFPQTLHLYFWFPAFICLSSFFTIFTFHTFYYITNSLFGHSRAVGSNAPKEMLNTLSIKIY